MVCVSVLVGKLHKPVSALCDLPAATLKHHLRQHLKKDILQWEKRTGLRYQMEKEIIMNRKNR